MSRRRNMRPRKAIAPRAVVTVQLDAHEPDAVDDDLDFADGWDDEPEYDSVANHAVLNHPGHADQSSHGRRRKRTPDAPDGPDGPSERWRGPSGPTEHTGEAARRAEEERRSGETARPKPARRPRRSSEGPFAPGETWKGPSRERWQGPSGPRESTGDAAREAEEERRSRPASPKRRRAPRPKRESPFAPGERYAGANSWWEISNLADDAAVVHIYNEIGGMAGLSADAFKTDLSNVDAKVINLHINSPGGDVFDGIAIHNALRNHPAQVHVHVDGVAASIASVIAMAGDKVTMARGAQMMIHEGHTVAVGNAADMAKVVDVLNKTSDTIASFYAERAGGTKEQWRERMRAETWYTAEEAVKAGLADEVEAPSRAVRNSWDLSVFNYAGRSKAPAPDLTKAAEPEPEPAPAAPAPTAAPVKAQVKDSWTDLIGSLLGKSNPDAVFATLVEAL